MRFSRAYVATMYLVLVLDVALGVLNAMVGNWWVVAVVAGCLAFLIVGIRAVHRLRREYP